MRARWSIVAGAAACVLAGLFAVLATATAQSPDRPFGGPAGRAEEERPFGGPPPKHRAPPKRSSKCRTQVGVCQLDNDRPVGASCVCPDGKGGRVVE